MKHPSIKLPITEKAERFLQAWHEYAKEVYQTGKRAGFYDHKHTGRGFNHDQKLLLIVSEIIEGHDALRKAPWPGIPDDKLTHRAMLEVELADAVVRIMNYSSHCGLDVAAALVEKAEFNKTRGHRHGGKRF